MSVMVTGGGGMLGYQIALQLLSRGEQPILYDVAHRPQLLAEVHDQAIIARGDILDFPRVIDVARKHGATHIIHVAALLTPAALENPHHTIKVNVEGTLNVLETARQLGIERVVLCSSQSVYNRAIPSDGPLNEDHPLRPPSVYASSKLASEFFGLNYAEAYGFTFIALRFAGLYGPGDPYPYGKMGFRPLTKLLSDAFAGRPVRLGAEFRNKHEPLYVKDAAAATILGCFATPPEHRVFNVSSGELYGFEEFVSALKAAVPEAHIDATNDSGEIDPAMRYVHARETPCDISRARSELGYQPNYPIREGLRDHIDWVRARL